MIPFIQMWLFRALQITLVPLLLLSLWYAGYVLLNDDGWGIILVSIILLSTTVYFFIAVLLLRWLRSMFSEERMLYVYVIPAVYFCVLGIWWMVFLRTEISDFVLFVSSVVLPVLSCPWVILQSTHQSRSLISVMIYTIGLTSFCSILFLMLFHSGIIWKIFDVL